MINKAKKEINNMTMVKKIMNKKIKFTILTTLFTFILFSGATAQMFSVPGHITREMIKDSVQYNGHNVRYFKSLPVNYDSTKFYPAMIAFSGGLAFERIVEYCYFTQFRSIYIRKDFITIMPVADEGKSFKDYTDDDLKLMLGAIRQQESIADTGWIAAGTAFGSHAAFNLPRIYPAMFQGIIVMPGEIPFNDIPEEWKHLKILLAIPEKDSYEWKEYWEKTYKI